MKTSKIEIDLDELKQEVKDFLLSVERDRLTPKPVQRIGVIIEKLRQYKMVIVKANAPRGFKPDALGMEKTANLLGQHREAFLADAHPETGLPALRDWLKTLDCAFLLGGELYWRLNDCEWEGEVWTPMSYWVEQGWAMLYSDPHKGERPVPIDLADLEAWEHDEKELEYRLFARISIFLPERDLPIVEETTPFSIRWRGCSCRLGDNDGFRIIKRLIEAKGRPVSREDIALAIGNDDFSDQALRKAASRLKKKLRSEGLGELADRIQTGENGQCIYLDKAI